MHFLDVSHRAGPTFSADAARRGKVSQQGHAGLTAVRWEFDGPLFGVEGPSENQLSSCPATVAVTELLDRNGFITEFGWKRFVKDVVDGVKEVISHPHQLRGPALPEQDEVVHKHVGMCYGQLVGSIREVKRSRRPRFSNSCRRGQIIMRCGKGA